MSNKKGEREEGGTRRCWSCVLGWLKRDNNDREIVGRITAQGKVEEGAGGLLRVLDVPYFVDRVLIFADVPKLPATDHQYMSMSPGSV
jgi:hypothetical protein